MLSYQKRLPAAMRVFSFFFLMNQLRFHPALLLVARALVALVSQESGFGRMERQKRRQSNFLGQKAIFFATSLVGFELQQPQLPTPPLNNTANTPTSTHHHHHYHDHHRTAQYHYNSRWTHQVCYTGTSGGHVTSHLSRLELATNQKNKWSSLAVPTR